MLKAIMVVRAEHFQKMGWYDGMISFFQGGKLVVLIIEDLDGIPATPWITSELRDSEDDEDSDCKRASCHWQPYNTTAQNCSAKKTVFF